MRTKDYIRKTKMAGERTSRSNRDEAPASEGLIAATAAAERERIAGRTLDMPDGGRVIVAAGTADEVMATVVAPDGTRTLRTFTRGEFDALTDQCEAARIPNESEAVSVSQSTGESTPPAEEVSESTNATAAAPQEALRVHRAPEVDTADVADEPVGGFDPDAEAAAALERIRQHGEQRQEEAEAGLEAAYPAVDAHSGAEVNTEVSTGSDEPELRAEVADDTVAAADATEVSASNTPTREGGENEPEHVDVSEPARDTTPSTDDGENPESFDDVADRLAGSLGISYEDGSTPAAAGGDPATPEVVAPATPEAEVQPGLSPEVLAVLSSIGAGEQVDADLLQPLTPEQRAALAALGVNAEANPTQPTQVPTQEGGHPITEALRAEMERQIAARTQELQERFGTRRQECLDRYAQLKADDETKGRWGRRKREVALKEAESALFEVEYQYAQALVENRRQGGGYENLEPADAIQKQSDDFFNQLRTMDGRSRQATVDVRLDRAKNRNIFQKAAYQLGRFFNWGNNGFGRTEKRAGVAFAATHGKNAVAGFLATGVPLALGAAWPVTLIAGGIGMAGRYGAVLNNEDRLLQSRLDENGSVQPTMSNEQFDRFMAAMRQSGASVDQQAVRLSQEFFNTSREQGRADADQARKRASRNLTSFALGGVVGGFTGNWVHGLMNPPQAHVDVVPHANEGTPPHVRYPDGTGGIIDKLPMNADTISKGEGWYYQFADMGMSPNQAHKLFADHTVMDKLVKVGAAYVDNSQNIGGYGINMPRSGHLSAKAMKIITDAMQAKGY